jgi:hypothetical protein
MCAGGWLVYIHDAEAKRAIDAARALSDSGLLGEDFIEILFMEINTVMENSLHKMVELTEDPLETLKIILGTFDREFMYSGSAKATADCMRASCTP